MKKIILIIMIYMPLCFSQSIIPNPTINPGTNYTFLWNEVIGDFDGDGSADILLVWKALALDKFVITIYSHAKESYLLQTNSEFGTRDAIKFADTNNDKKVELIVGTRIYLFSPAVNKKKGQ
jgi:hypothetical protein